MTAPNWHDVPTTPGIWVWLRWGQHPFAWKFTQKEIDDFDPHGQEKSVYGPIPPRPERKGTER